MSEQNIQFAQQQEGLTHDEIALMLGHQLLQLRMNAKQIMAQQAIIDSLTAKLGANVQPIKEAKA